MLRAAAFLEFFAASARTWVITACLTGSGRHIGGRFLVNIAEKDGLLTLKQKAFIQSQLHDFDFFIRQAARQVFNLTE